MYFLFIEFKDPSIFYTDDHFRISHEQFLSHCFRRQYLLIIPVLLVASLYALVENRLYSN